MKKYYLHNGTESSGPFDSEELKALKITSKTPIWFEGMENWKTAGEIMELKTVFEPEIPAFESVSEPVIKNLKTKTNTSKTEVERKILGLSKTNLLIISIILIVIIGTYFFNTLQEERSRELRIKNHKTEVENYQLELKQKALEEEKMQSIIQEKIEAERAERNQKDSAENQLSTIEKQIRKYQSELDAAQKKLTDASSFKVLRTAAEKKEQMDLLQKNIDSFQSELSKLKTESDQLKLELEKIN